MKVYFIVMILFSAGFFGVRYVFAPPMRQYFGLRMYLSFAGILGAGFLLHNAALFVATAGVVLLVTVTSRTDALCRLAMLVALIPDVTYFVSAGGAYLGNLTTSDALSIGALLACILRPGLQARRGMGIEDALVLALMIIFSVGASRAANISGISREIVTIALGLGLPFFVFSRFVRDRAQFGYVVGALAGTALILAVIAIYEARFHWSVFYPVFANQSLGEVMSHSLRVRAGLMRTPTAFNESTSFAVFQLVGVFAIIASRRLFRNGFLWVGSFGLAIIGLLVAQSRGADLALLFGVFVLLMVRRRYILAAGIAAGGTLIVTLLILLASSIPKVAAFLGADRGYGSDGDYRQTLLRRGLQEGMRHPFFGDDKLRVVSRMADVVQGEGIVDFVNTYLMIFLNSGFVGLGLVVALLAAITWKIWPSRKTEKQDRYFISLQMFLAGALAAELLALLFTSFYERNPYWLMMIFAGCRVLRVSARSAGKSETQKLEGLNLEKPAEEQPLAPGPATDSPPLRPPPQSMTGRYAT